MPGIYRYRSQHMKDESPPTMREILALAVRAIYSFFDAMVAEPYFLDHQ